MRGYDLAMQDEAHERLAAIEELKHLRDPQAPRRDRTFFVNLEVSRAHAELLRTHPDRVRANARELFPRFRSTVRGMALDWLSEWETLLNGPDDAVIEMLIREDQHGAEMRVNAPFAGLLTSAERAAALQRARNQLEAERSR
jgi:hypothetical protein